MPDNIIRELGTSITKQDIGRVRQILEANPGLLRNNPSAQTMMDFAITRKRIDILEILVDAGADINAAGRDGSGQGALFSAACKGDQEVVRWLLQRGAVVNRIVDGTQICFSLNAAIRLGHLEVIKLLVANGANIQAVRDDKNPLTWAKLYKQPQIEAFLRESGAVDLPGDADPPVTDPIVVHVAKYFGKPEPLAWREIMPTDPSIAIHVFRRLDRAILVTSGMSSKPMRVPKGGERYQFAELMMFLPPDWPLNEAGLRDPNHFWPLEWMRRIALFPFLNDTWLGGKTMIAANGEPPTPLGPNTSMTCMLAFWESKTPPVLDLDGRHIGFYTLFPLHTDERDLEKRTSMNQLFELFDRTGVSMIVDPQRKSVVSA